MSYSATVPHIAILVIARHGFFLLAYLQIHRLHSCFATKVTLLCLVRILRFFKQFPSRFEDIWWDGLTFEGLLLDRAWIGWLLDCLSYQIWFRITHSCFTLHSYQSRTTLKDMSKERLGLWVASQRVWYIRVCDKYFELKFWKSRLYAALFGNVFITISIHFLAQFSPWNLWRKIKMIRSDLQFIHIHR